LKTQHQITAVIINKVSLFLKNEIISVNVNKTEMTYLWLLFWGVPVEIYQHLYAIYKKKHWENKKTFKNATTIKT